MALSTSSFVNISNKNIEIIVNKVMPIMSIGSLSQKSSHVLNMDTLSKASRKRSLLASSANNMTIMMSVTRASLYSNLTRTSAFNNRIETQINANPLRIQLNCSQRQNINIQIRLSNYKTQDYNPVDPLMSFQTTCSNRNELFVYTCVYPDDSKYKISFVCNEKMNQTFVSTCPSRRRSKPFCELGSPYGVCYMSEYTSEYTVCSCTICGTNVTTGNRLLGAVSPSIGIVSYQIVSVITLFYEDYTSKKIILPSTLTVKQTLIVYISYASVWIFVVFYFLCKRWSSAASTSAKNKKTRSVTVISLVPTATESIRSRQKKEIAIRDYLYLYLPPIFRYNTTAYLGQSLRNHHLHLSLLMNTKRNTVNEVSLH